MLDLVSQPLELPFSKAGHLHTSTGRLLGASGVVFWELLVALLDLVSQAFEQLELPFSKAGHLYTSMLRS